MADLAPVGMGEERREDVGDEDERNRQEDPLDRPVAREQDQRPDEHRDKGHGDIPRDAEDLEGRRGARELGDGVGQVGDQQDEHRESRPADAEAIADQVREALPGDDAQAGGDLLDDGQDDDRDREDPEQPEARLGAHHAVGGDATGIVAGDAGDQPGAHDREECQQPAPAAEAAPQAQELAVRDPVAEAAEEPDPGRPGGQPAAALGRVAPGLDCPAGTRLGLLGDAADGGQLRHDSVPARVRPSRARRGAAGAASRRWAGPYRGRRRP